MDSADKKYINEALINGETIRFDFQDENIDFPKRWPNLDLDYLGRGIHVRHEGQKPLSAENMHFWKEQEKLK